MSNASMLIRRAGSLSVEAGKRPVLVLQALFVAAVTITHLGKGIVPSPFLLVVAALSVMMAAVHPGRFWYPLLPFALLGTGYQSLERLSRSLTPADLNITNLIIWERSLFGGVIPTTWLQEKLFDRSFTVVLDVVSNLLYFSHFVIPLTAGMILWAYRREWFWPYVFGLLLFSYLGFGTYLLFPAAPPWWAHFYGYLADAIDLSHFVLSEEAMLATPNPLAAMPSLHCGYPLFVTLVLSALWGRRWHLLHLLPLGVGFAVVYLGHHYVIDVLMGYVYGLLGFMVTFAVIRRRTLSIEHPGP